MDPILLDFIKQRSVPLLILLFGMATVGLFVWFKFNRIIKKYQQSGIDPFGINELPALNPLKVVGVVKKVLFFKITDVKMSQEMKVLRKWILFFIILAVITAGFGVFCAVNLGYALRSQ